MFPILLEIGPFSIRTYGALVALGFFAALRLMRTAARTRHLPEGFVLDLCALLVVSGLLGARLLYVVLNMPYYLDHPLEIFEIWKGGLVFYGGFVVATVVGMWYTRFRGQSVPVVADCSAPALAIAQALGRTGCFFAGCCYGRPTSVPWAVEFKDPASLAPLGIPIHPVQLYEALANLLIGAFLWVRLKRGTHPKGQIFWLYLLLYAAVRFAIEVLRGDERGPAVGGLFPSQMIALAALLLAGSILIAQAASKTGLHYGRLSENYR